MITWDLVFLPFSFLENVLAILFSLSVTIGSLMINVLKWAYEYSSYLLLLLSVIYQLLLWVATIVWTLICAAVSASSVVGKVLFTNLMIILQYGYHALSYLPSGLYTIVIFSYNIVMSLATNGWLLVKESIWPGILYCVILITSMTTYVINIMYNLVIVLCGHLLNIVVSIGQFIQHTASPFVASVFYYLFIGLVEMTEYCYAIIMTVLYHLTALMLRIIDTLPGILQPIATDVVYYGSDIVAMVISGMFNVLILIMTVMRLLITTPSFWAITLATIMLSFAYYYYTKHWAKTRGMATAPAVAERKESNIRSVTDEHYQSTPGENDAEMERLREEMLCVVCQFEKKTILLRPCNHLCLCSNCVDEVLENNRICPLCRRYVNQSIKVYI